MDIISDRDVCGSTAGKSNLIFEVVGVSKFQKKIDLSTLAPSGGNGCTSPLSFDDFSREKEIAINFL